MKDSKDYSKKIQKLYHGLKNKYPKPAKVFYDEPLDALVYAVISENMTEAEAQSAMKRMTQNFVDLNDLRVSLTMEILEMLGANNPVMKNTASALSGILKAVFEENNTVSLEHLKKIGKRPARDILEKIPGTDKFVIDYCMLTSLRAHAIPLTKRMVEYLKTNQFVHPESDEQDIEGFLARQISADNAYEFYALLRHESEPGQSGAKKTASKSKVKTAAKTKGEKEETIA
jgi:endonuclease III